VKSIVVAGEYAQEEVQLRQRGKHNTVRHVRAASIP
jgi:hypothetical protein